MSSSPTLDDISISYSLISLSSETMMLDDDAYRALIRLVSSCAARLVWTYNAPSDGSLPDDDDVLARIAGFRRWRWREIRSQLQPYFRVECGRWHLNRPWISVAGGGRFAIPLEIQREVLAREGRHCTYCGDTNGPFDFDHIFPVSRGGSNDASNLTLACASCNRSKGAKTLSEWIASRTGGELS